MSCDHITWPDLSALRVLKIVICGKTSWKLNTLLPHLSLKSLTIAPANDMTLHCQVEYDDCVAIGDHVISTNSLKELHLLAHSINVKGVEAITAALERLEFKCECTFTATAGDSLAQFITNTTTLKYLSIKKCTLSAHALLVLSRAIDHNSILQTKNVEEFMLTVNGDSEAKDLAQLLVEYQELMDKMYSPMSYMYKYMYIDCNGVSDAGAVALGQALHHNSTLTHLYLSNNGISDAGAVALSQAVHHNSTLIQLHLSNDSISDAGSLALAQALRHNSTLIQLHLSNNRISDPGAEALAQALHHNSTLIQLHLSNNSISDAGSLALAQALRHNTTLTWLDLSNNSISDTGAVSLDQASITTLP